MIAFITSLRHPLNNNSYERAVALATGSLRSVCHQTSDEFRVFVVCNQVPPVAFSHPKVHFLPVGFPPPSALASPHLSVEEVRLDKGCKYVVGLLHAKRFNPSHVMFFDADDLVSNRIAQFVSRNDGGNGWFANAGYVYCASRNALLALDDGFQTRCGTCYIVRTSLYSLPWDLPTDVSQDCILSQLGSKYVLEVFGSHRYLQDYLSAKGTPLEPLPFKGVIYHAEHGENWTRSFGFTKRLRKVALTDELRREFNLWHGENPVAQASPDPLLDNSVSLPANSDPLQG